MSKNRASAMAKLLPEELENLFPGARRPIRRANHKDTEKQVKQVQEPKKIKNNNDANAVTIHTANTITTPINQLTPLSLTVESSPLTDTLVTSFDLVINELIRRLQVDPSQFTNRELLQALKEISGQFLAIQKQIQEAENNSQQDNTMLQLQSLFTEVQSRLSTQKDE